MEHSVQAYLERQPTEKLEEFLRKREKEQQKQAYDHILPLILAVLERRKMQ